MEKPNRYEIKVAIQKTADKLGVVTPDGVVKAAKNPKNPLHGEFNWDDAAAAHQHRLDVARSLIREIRYVSVDSTDRTIRRIEYVHNPKERGQAYVPISKLKDDKEKAGAIIDAEFVRIEAAIDRAREIADTLGLGPDLEAMIDSVAKARKKIKKASA